MYRKLTTLADCACVTAPFFLPDACGLTGDREIITLFPTSLREECCSNCSVIVVIIALMMFVLLQGRMKAILGAKMLLILIEDTKKKVKILFCCLKALEV